ncbi:hypothetical protein GCM10007972_15800 [Iodidimonas muriae]|uniref:Uncharacterized protein n=1 Tax=Iodidimonas muriae TaxID=261467 RepID=A0ABQ2LD43_9PROT|nr:hypothetical protein [Iodidimonas muriae]GER07961.1 hypothetical protein JCM17843_22710 [Kordiimonadales bacterium JCM 17843]GGO11754.1 hypothetical protein GCM10007972_15800 [Iodidimonas muriae]
MQQRTDIKEIRNELQTGLKEEKDVRRNDDQKLVQKLEDAVIGGIHIELAGLAFLTVGVQLGTIPDQVAPLLGLQ